MDGRYYVCRLPAEKQHFHKRTPKTEYFGIHFVGENGTYRVTNIVKKDLSKIGTAAVNHREFGDSVVAGVPSQQDFSQSRRYLHDPNLRLLLDRLTRHHGDLEALSTEELRIAGIEGAVEKSTQ